VVVGVEVRGGGGGGGAVVPVPALVLKVVGQYGEKG